MRVLGRGMSEEEGYRRLAEAVIMQWMEDFEDAYRRFLRGGRLRDEDWVTLRWLDMWECRFWCEVAGVDIYWLRVWAERIKSWLEKEMVWNDKEG